MANQKHVALSKSGVNAWNLWRQQNPEIIPDLRGADFREANLDGFDLRRSNLRNADFTKASLLDADLSDASLHSALLAEANLNRAHCARAVFDDAGGYMATLVNADFRLASLQNVVFGPTDASSVDFSEANLNRVALRGASLRFAKMRRAVLTSAGLEGANLSDADLSESDLSGAVLERTTLVNTSFRASKLSGARIYGASVWNVDMEGAIQEALVVSPAGQPSVSVDNLEIAQFVFLVLNNKKVREVIDAVTSKIVLILGRFSPERKAVLDSIRLEVRKFGYVPVLFDFDPPANRDLTETVSTLAHLARFVIADITDARSIPQELSRIVPNLPSVPVQPLLLASEGEYGMFETFKRYPWVLELLRYQDEQDLLSEFGRKVVEPAEAMVQKCLGKPRKT